MKGYDIPCNTPQLASCRIIDFIFKAFLRVVTREASDMAYVESAVCKTVVAQSRAMNKLIELKKQLNVEATRV